MSDHLQPDMPRQPLVYTLAAGLVSMIAACDSGTISKKDASSFVERWAAQANESLDAQVDVDDAPARLESAVETKAAAAEEAVSRTEPPYDVFVRDVYADLGWELRLASDDGLTDRGETVWSILRKADEHALDLDGFEFDAIDERLERIEKFDEEVAEFDSFSLEDRERKQAVEWLQKQPRDEFELDEKNFDRLIAAVVDSKAGDRLADHVEQLRDAYERRERAVAELEHLLARNSVRYSRKMRHFRIKHVYIHPREDDYWSSPILKRKKDNFRRPDRAKGPRVGGHVWRKAARVADDIKQPVAILHRRIRETLHRVLTDDDPGEVLRDLAPDHPQYAKLRDEYRRYREIVDEEGWQKVTPTDGLGRGVRHEVVSALKKRLRAEDYYPEEADTDTLYDGTLEEAVEAYQRTHQMTVSGRPHHMFWVSLNQPAEYRMRQIGLNLKRWRETNVRHREDSTYALINIPGFHAELWDNQQREMRFAIVVGNDDKKIPDEEDDKEQQAPEVQEDEAEERPNHTPELSAYIDRVIYNPYWNVTDRIRENELLPKVRHSLEQKYKARLRELRKQKRGIGRHEAEGGDSDSEQASALGDQYFVSTGSAEQADDEEADSTISSGPLGGPGDGSDEESSSDDGGDSDGDGDAADEGKSDEPKVAIDDLFEMVEDKNAVEDIDKRAVFDVAAIRSLIEAAEQAEKRRESSAFDPTGSGLFGGDSPSEASSNEAEASNEQNDEEGEDKSPIERKFPYLDPESGEVTVSATDSDNDPEWYDDNDYEVMFPGKEWEYVRMTQGDHNALGRVKVIFPNRHAVYLHDTPKQNLFSRNIRAFSHGCMRMHKPLDFAEQLLRYDGKLENVNVPKLLEGEEKPVEDEKGEKTDETEVQYTYKPVFLDEQIPVHVEYFTVRVLGDEGRANFFADVYDKDKKALGGDESKDGARKNGG